jgi:glutamyl-tRNA reductase
MEIFVVGLSHKTAPVAVRERLAVAPGEMEPQLQLLARLPGLREVVLLSTCNRVEVYGAYSDAEAAVSAVLGHLQAQLGEPPAAPGGEHLKARVGGEAVHHLFRVAASLDSLVVGEPQILGQLKDAFDLAVRARTAGPLLRLIFPRGFRVAKRVRRDTAIAEQPVSVSSVAVSLARQVWDRLASRRVLLIGAGEMAALAARSLRAEGAALAVVNRTRARAEELAGELGGAVEVDDFPALGAALARTDIVISSTGAREPVLTRTLVAEAQKARRGRPLVIIDIAVPRDVEPAAGKVRDVLLYDIDDLEQVVAKNLKDRRHEADRAEVLVEEELGRFLALARGRAAGPTIAALRAHCLNVARAEAERAASGLGSIDERTRRALELLASGLVAKLLHAPSVALKKEAEASADDGLSLAAAVQRLFNLPQVAAVEAAVVAEDGGEGEAGRPAAAETEVAASTDVDDLQKVVRR